MYRFSGELILFTAERVFKHRPFEPDTGNAGQGDFFQRYFFRKISPVYLQCQEEFFLSNKHSTTVIITEGALCLALSFVLTKINLFTMPQGGSVDFELVPLILFTYRRGWKWGIRIGILSGIMHIILGAYFYTVVQVILDYPIAYSFIGLADLHPFWLGLIAAWAGMTASSVISGAIFFAQYAPEGQNPWVYSFLYNAPVLGVKYIVSGIAAFALWKILERDLSI